MVQLDWSLCCCVCASYSAILVDLFELTFVFVECILKILAWTR